LTLGRLAGAAADALAASEAVGANDTADADHLNEAVRTYERYQAEFA
jgi:hypothetical protein